MIGPARSAWVFDPEKTAGELFDAGVFTNPVAPPAVPEGRCCLRTSYMATHTDDQLDFVLEQLGRVGKKYGVLGHGIEVA